MNFEREQIGRSKMRSDFEKRKSATDVLTHVFGSEIVKLFV